MSVWAPSWYPNQTDLASQNFTLIEAEGGVNKAQSEMQKWVVSGIHFSNLVSISIVNSSDVSVNAQLDGDGCADCTTCEKCQMACWSLAWCLPCWGM